MIYGSVRKWGMRMYTHVYARNVHFNGANDDNLWNGRYPICGLSHKFPRALDLTNNGDLRLFKPHKSRYHGDMLGYFFGHFDQLGIAGNI